MHTMYLLYFLTPNISLLRVQWVTAATTAAAIVLRLMTVFCQLPLMNAYCMLDIAHCTAVYKPGKNI